MSTDAILESLVSSVEGSDLTPGITLTINGVVVSGLLISSETYKGYMQDEVEAGINDSSAAASISSAIESASSKGYLHLRDAKIISGDDHFPESTGILWRGKLSDVNGFTLGTF